MGLVVILVGVVALAVLPGLLAHAAIRAGRWSLEAWRRRRVVPVDPDVAVGEPLIDPETISARLQALSDELARLSDDRATFARAFHIEACRTAVGALEADALRAARRPTLNLSPLVEVGAFDAAGGGYDEVLEL